MEVDSPWKEVVENLFEDFLAFFFAQIHSATLAAIKFHHKDTKATKKSLCELGVFVVKMIFVVVIIFSE